MKAAVKTAWIADLRENPDAQGNGRLDYIDSDGKRKQCCLGRLCRLAVAAGVIPEPELGDSTYRYLDDNGNSLGNSDDATGESFHQECSLPQKVQDWAGLDYHDIVVVPEDGNGGGLTAIRANDSVGMTFAQIADEAGKNVPVTE